MKPTIFIASSSEHLSVAKTIAKALNDLDLWNVTVWTEAFAFSAAFIESLEDHLDRADFAIVVLTVGQPPVSLPSRRRGRDPGGRLEG